MKRIIVGASAAIMGLTSLATAMPAFGAEVNVCPINGSKGIFKATGPITISERVLDTPAFAGNPAGDPGEGPFWPAN